MGLRNQRVEHTGRLVNIMQEILSDGSHCYNVVITDSECRKVELTCDSFAAADKIYQVINNSCD